MEKEKEKLYFRPCDYNRAYMLKVITRLLKKEGAKVFTYDFCNNTTIYERVEIEASEEREAKAERNGSFNTYGILNITFTFNGYYYYYALDKNPFFNGLFVKIKIDNDGSYKGDRYANTENDITSNNAECIKMNKYDIYKLVSKQTLKKWAFDFYKTDFQKFINMQECRVIRDKIRVSNTYNNGSHFEYKYNNKENNVFTKYYSRKVIFY